MMNFPFSDSRLRPFDPMEGPPDPALTMLELLTNLSLGGGEATLKVIGPILT